CSAGHDAREAGRRKGLPVGGIDQHSSHNEKCEDGADLDDDHYIVRAGGFAHAADQQQGEDEYDQECGQVEIRAGPLASGPYGTGPLIGDDQAEGGELGLGVSAEADGDGHVADGVFQDEVPADDPGKNFAEGGVRVGVGAAGDGNHGGEFRIAQAGKGAGDGDQNE